VIFTQFWELPAKTAQLCCMRVSAGGFNRHRVTQCFRSSCWAATTHRTTATRQGQMEQPKGKFIVFEGIDGSGKGTQLLRCAGFIFDLSKENDVYITREPTRDFKQLREEMRKGQEVHQNAEWYAKTFIKDRRNHVDNYILPALNKGTHVICDRYKHSTLVYQHSQGMRLEDLQAMHEGILVPDLTLIFDLDSNIAFQRRKGGGAIDVFDKDKEFLKVLRDNYRKLKDVLAEENVVYIDAARTREEVEQDVQEQVRKVLGQ